MSRRLTAQTGTVACLLTSLFKTYLQKKRPVKYVEDKFPEDVWVWVCAQHRREEGNSRCAATALLYPSPWRSRSQAPGAAPSQPRAGPGSIDHGSPLRRRSGTPRNAWCCSGHRTAWLRFCPSFMLADAPLTPVSVLPSNGNWGKCWQHQTRGYHLYFTKNAPRLPRKR